MGVDYGLHHMGDAIEFCYQGITSTPMGTIGSRIRELRKAHELTQVELAKAVGIDQSTLSDIERGVNFAADVLYRLCRELDTTAEYVMSGSDPEAWPFPRVPMARFLALPESDQAFVEGRLLSSIEACENPPSGSAKDLFRSATKGKPLVRRKKA